MLWDGADCYLPGIVAMRVEKMSVTYAPAALANSRQGCAAYEIGMSCHHRFVLKKCRRTHDIAAADHVVHLLRDLLVCGHQKIKSGAACKK
jgi:hypothetical protein